MGDLGPIFSLPAYFMTEITINNKVRKPGSGRKKIADRDQIKVQFSIYLKRGLIAKLGGPDKVRAIIYDYLGQIDWLCPKYQIICLFISIILY